MNDLSVSHREGSSLPESRRRRQRRHWLVVGGVLAALAAALLIAGGELFTSPPVDSVPATGPPRSLSPDAPLLVETPTPFEAKTGGRDDEAAEPAWELVDDDGQTQWMSPTAGPPWEPACLPPGVQIILAMRPAALAAHTEGEKVLAALGPLGAAGVRNVELAAGIAWRDIDRLVIGWHETLDSRWDATLVVAASSPAGFDDLERRLAKGEHRRHAGQPYVVAQDRAYFRPAGAERRVLVVAAPKSIAEIIDLDKAAPPLRRGIERLLSVSDSARHATLICAPSFLYSEGGGLFAGHLAGLRDPLFWFLGDGPSAVALSLHWDESFFVELAATPTLDVPAERLADELERRVAELPDRVEEFVLNLTPSTYSRRIVARLPGMVRKLAAYTRSDFTKDHAKLQCYLPTIAGHNLLLAAELTLAESAAGSTARPSSTATISERLQRRTSLRFPRDTLENALRLLSDDTGVPIVIRGADLQLAGITKNQSFGIDVADRPVEQILVEILRLANPDKTAASPADPRQKLVYVVGRQTPGGPEVVIVTTRAKAEEAGETLPPVFLPGSR